MSKVSDCIDSDQWSLSDGVINTFPYILRYRTPIIKPGEATEYDQRLSIVWPYADEDSRELPSAEELEEMEDLENVLCEAFEEDYHAILTAVLTFDGARQWIFYTKDISECENRLNEAPQKEEPYPIEFATSTDPNWTFLHNDIFNALRIK